MSVAQVFDRLVGVKPGAHRFQHIRRRVDGHRSGLRPRVEVLDERVLLTASAQLPTGQYLNALEALVSPVVGTEVNNLLANDDIPGMGVAITYQGSVILDQGYGFTGDTAGTTDAANTPPVTASTPFAVGSVSKTFSAIATLMIAQDPALIDTSANPRITSLNLDAPISTYLPPGVPIALPGLPSPPPTDANTFTLPTNWGNLTTRELLLMSSGTPDDTGTTPWNEVIAGITNPKTGMAKLIFTTPGSDYYYSDDGYKVVGELIEKLTNMTYAQFVQQQIFTPLGMNQSTVLTGPNTAESISGAAVGYNTYTPSTGTGNTTLADALFTGYSAFSGGAVVTTAQDLGIYLSALWNQSSVLLDPSMYQSMWTPVPLINVNPEYYGMHVTPGMGWDGVDVDPTDGNTVIFKNGAVPGYQAQINLYTTEGFGIAVAYNLTNSVFESGNVGAGTVISAINTAVLSRHGPGFRARDGWSRRTSGERPASRDR